MFCQDFAKDFDAVLAQTEPFALVRFGDGEIALVDGVAHQSADQWRTAGPSWMRSEIIESLRYEADGWCVGIPTRCCLGNGVRINPAVRVPRERQTFATLFLHDNLRRASLLREHFSHAVLVGSWFGDLRIDPDCVSKPVDLDPIVAAMLTADTPILLAAGPAANVLALRYWKLQSPEKRQSVIDVGSALDVVHGKQSRHFHTTMTDHVCSWTPVAQARPRTSRTANIIPPPTRPIEVLPKVDRPSLLITPIGRQTPSDAVHVGPRKITQRRR